MIFAHHRSDHRHEGGPWCGNHLQTDYIQINRRICLACGQCTSECSRGVIGQVKWFRHSHAHIDKAEECIGCKKCVKVCSNGAITELSSTKPGLIDGKKREPGRTLSRPMPGNDHKFQVVQFR